jgi:hypothetical protein
MGTVDGRGIWINLTLISITCGGPSTQDSKKKNKEKTMKTLIAGSNGMVGSAVTRHLIEAVGKRR